MASRVYLLKKELLDSTRNQGEEAGAIEANQGGKV